ncbi:hypothetical protein [uncultured Ruegeria sp.]|uniref:hypothetical protein n=1 Tax=uncultured Ruegeria sp. TaxID=259304 RepID=UPI00262826FD|nr:hypothetical protein [uncultured Ruegeria sp.]
MDPEEIRKAELHCHLIGVIDASLLNKLPHFGSDPLLDPTEILPPEKVNGQDGFLAWLESLGPYRNASWTAFLPIVQAHLNNLRKQNVVYAEIMISPIMFSGVLDAAIVELRQFVEETQRLSQDAPIIRYLFVIPRSATVEMIAKDTQFFLAAKQERLIVGAAVVGLSHEQDLRQLFPMLSTLKDHGLGIEIHTGEHTEAAEVQEVLNSGLADRLGHAISGFSAPDIIDAMARASIHVEFCPTSNLKTGVIASANDLPIRQALDNNIAFSINTDDPGAFGCSLTGEFSLIAEAHELDASVLHQIYRDTIRAAFDPNLELPG